jgi:hypothetical protein
MKDFNFNKYIRHGFLLREDIQNDDEPTGDAEYTSDTEFDIWDQGDESDPIDDPLGDGSEWQEGDEDMFNDWENIPDEVKTILDKYSEEDNDYRVLRKMQKELENETGYTFDWGLDAEPYGLRPMKK